MVDERQPAPGLPAQGKAPGKDAKPDADWGEDWESAFQAEEFLIDEDRGGEAGSFDFSPAESGGFGDLPSFDEEEPDAPTDDQAEPDKAGATAAPTGGFIGNLLSRFAKLPILARLGIPAALILLVAIGLLLPVFRTEPPTMQPATPAPTADTSTASPPAQALRSEITDTTTTPALDPQAALPPIEIQQNRTKWPFAPFLIPAEDPTSKEIVFVTVELSLVTLVAEGDQLPLTQKPLVRDMIFQFFVNRPLYDLRRYRLARGEMNKQLLEWLARQWPDGELEAIIFHQYELS